MILNLKALPPLSLYIHLPWCVKKCPYCDFNSHEFTNSGFEEDRYIDALIRDLETELPRVWGRTIKSVFIGGGTPSLFSVTALEKLLSAIRARLNIHPAIEITLEANPGTAEAEKFQGYSAIGINRLSIGVQSFNDEHLTALGRIHDSSQALNAIALAKQAGFDNFNIDLMFGLPNQTLADALNDLQMATAQIPSHISWYQLTIEPNTVFNSKPPVLPNEDEIWEIQKTGQQLLADSGFKQYEISAYAKNNSKCLHNLNYWGFGDYLGIGAGAHAKITNVVKGKIERFKRHKLPARYIELAGSESVITEIKTLKRHDMSLEFMMNSMRLIEGFPTRLFLERTGQPLSVVRQILTDAEQKKLIEWQADRLMPSTRGVRYLNELLALFMN